MSGYGRDRGGDEPELPYGADITTARVEVGEHVTDATITGPRDRGVITVLRGPTPGILYALDRPRSVIGRGGGVEILISDSGISRQHAAIIRTPDGYLLEDLGSTNGTSLDGRTIDFATPLEDGARIGLGRGTLLGFGLRDDVEQEAARQTHDLAMRDPLTRLYNRRHLQERLDAELAYVERHGGSISVLMVDIDHFKTINDEFGHAAGDQVLQAVADALMTVVRKEDILSRYGGEEFLIIARGIDATGASVLGERIRQAVSDLELPAAAERRVTVSVGVAHADGHRAAGSASLVQLADSALYTAKSLGRDRVEMRAARVPRATIRQSRPK